MVGTYGPMILGAIVSAVAGWLGIAAHRRAWLRDFLARAQAERRTVALEVEQTYVDRLLKAREASSPGGAELTPAEKEAALMAAVSRFQEMLGLTAIDRYLRLLGLPRVPTAIRRWCVSHVEAAVKELSIEQREAATSRNVAVVNVVAGTETPTGPIPAGRQ